ncbi:MAG: methyltransferase FkbM [Flavobacteriales bacterium]|nr:MAG: methyltransferase FkbM [Flavobacteriales bacterium]
MNKFLYYLSLKGMGVLNYKDDFISGEEKFIANYFLGLDSPVVFDVGANVGNYSKKLLTSQKDITVYAFEPHPKTYVNLTANIEASNFKSFNVGVGKEKGEFELFDYLDQDGSSHASLYKEVIEDIHKRESVKHLVSIISLDEFVLEHNVGVIDLLKIDTEGNELNVLKGFSKHIENKNVKAIHFEFNEMNIASKTSFKDFWDLLPNYTFYRLLPGGRMLELKSYAPILCEIYAYQNIIAILK